MRTIRSIAGRVTAVLAAVAALGACEKNAVQELTSSPMESRIRFFNFAVGSPAVHFYANDTKLTATLSSTGAEATTAVSYGNVGSGGYYSSLSPGQYTFTARAMTVADKGVPIGTLAGQVEASKAYSLYLAGRYNTTTKTAESFLIEDAIPETFDFTQALVRLVNASANSEPVSLIARNRATGAEVTIAGPVAYKASGAFTPVPNGVYDLHLRVPGEGTDLVEREEVSFVAGRVYTIALRGIIGVTGNTGPALDYTSNR